MSSTTLSPTRPVARLVFAATVAVALAGCDADPIRPATVPSPTTAADPAQSFSASAGPVVAKIRASTAHLRSIEAATAAGFIPASDCVAAPGLGGMGFHYLHPGRLGDGAVDPTAPEVLLFEPRADGGARLVGVEFLLVADAWDAQHDVPPSLMGVTFDEHRGAATHGLPFEHYELHVWSWRSNPAGITTPFNPKVSCDAA